MERKAYPSDVSDEERALVAPYLTLMTEDAPLRDFPLREGFNGLRYIVRTGAPWRWRPHDLPPWQVVYQQSQRWIKAGVFESLAHELRAVLRIADGRKERPTAAIIDSRTLQSTPESGGRAGYDGAKRRKAVRSIWQSIRSGICSPYALRPPMNRTAPKSQSSRGVCKRRPAKQSRSPTWIKATQVKTQPMRPGSMESSSKSSNFQRRREGLSSYRDDGWWGEVSAECHAFAVWRWIMNAYPKLWPDCITWPSSF